MSMGVYINEMEMPKNCGECYVGFCKQIGCELSIGFDWYNINRHPDCPLVSVPQHGRLIDADAMFKDICDDINSMTDVGIAVDGQWLWDKLNDALENAPTIFPAEEGET